VISTANIEDLIPDFLLESDHFHIVLTDVEGEIMQSNLKLGRLSGKPSRLGFSDVLSESSAKEFSNSLELMLSTPKIRRNLLLEHPSLGKLGGSPVWWEFSVITNSEMDISGIIGIGVGIQFLEQEMPWDHLVDVLSFGKIQMDPNFRIISVDDKIKGWLENEKVTGNSRSLFDLNSFEFSEDLEKLIKKGSLDFKPKCFTLPSKSFNSGFAAVLIGSRDGFQLFLVPKVEGNNFLPEKPTNQEDFEFLPGAVFVLDRNLNLFHQNLEAKDLGEKWNGRIFRIGDKLSFSNQIRKFDPLLKAIEQAAHGKSCDLEIRIGLKDKSTGLWKVQIKPKFDFLGSTELIFVYAFDLSDQYSRLNSILAENEDLRQLALIPSHILRGPLSSMLGLLDLIDTHQLDQENQKLFNYLRPLAHQLDHVIRNQAKKMGGLD
jgi:hypothetical protein